MRRIGRFFAAAVLGNLPYMKRSDRIGLIIQLVALALLLAVAAWGKYHRQ